MVTWELKEVLAEIGGNKRLTLTSWNNAAPKLDLRKWQEDGKPGRGMTLTDEEAQALLEALTAYLEGG